MRAWPRHLPRSGRFVGVVEMAVICALLVLGAQLGGYGRGTLPTLQRGQQRWPRRAWPASAPAYPPAATDFRFCRQRLEQAAVGSVRRGSGTEQEGPPKPCRQVSSRVGRERVRDGRGVQRTYAHRPARPERQIHDPLGHALRGDGPEAWAARCGPCSWPTSGRWACPRRPGRRRRPRCASAQQARSAGLR
jgi:hypothetical protein